MVPGLDGSFTNGKVVPVDWFRRRYAEGYRVYAQCVWTGGLAGNDGIKLVAAGNLLNAKAGGLKIVAYANASPPNWWSLPIQMQHIKENCGAAWPHVPLLPVDVELRGITYARVKELADALRAAGKNQAVEVLYSARWFWTSHMRNSRDVRWRRWKLWNANYDFNPDVDYASAPYGPWTLADLVGEQYQGTTRLDGVDVDLNVFDLEALFPASPVPAPKEETHMASAEFNSLSNAITRLSEKLRAQIAALQARVARLESKSVPVPRPAKPMYHTVVAGDTASTIAAKYNITMAQLKALNPGKPRSGNWNTIYSGEVFRVK